MTHAKKQNTYKPHNRRKFAYRLKNDQEDSGFRKSSKELYMIGLFVGTYLRRDAFYTSERKDKQNMSILKALRGGSNVYFLARDMSIFWRFFKDQYDNAKIVVGVNRKTESDYQKSIVDNHIDTKHKGIVFDSGFRGSCITPIVKHSGYKNHGGKQYKYLKGLMLSGSSDSLYPAMHTDQHRSFYRQVIYELEHCPKGERCEKYVDSMDDCDYACFNTLDKSVMIKEKAFELGFRAGLMGLNSSLLSNVVKLENHKQEIKERIRQMKRARFNGETVGAKLNMIEEKIKYGSAWFIVDSYDGLVLEFKPNTPKNRSYQRYPTFVNKAYAQRYLDVLKARKARRHEPTSFQLHIQAERRVENHLQDIEDYKKRIAKLESEWTKKILDPFTPKPASHTLFKMLMSSEHKDNSMLNKYNEWTEEQLLAKFTQSNDVYGNITFKHKEFQVTKCGDLCIPESSTGISLLYSKSSLKVCLTFILVIFDVFRADMPLFDAEGHYKTFQDNGLINGSNLRSFSDNLIKYLKKRVK